MLPTDAERIAKMKAILKEFEGKVQTSSRHRGPSSIGSFQRVRDVRRGEEVTVIGRRGGCSLINFTKNRLIVLGAVDLTQKEDWLRLE